MPRPLLPPRGVFIPTSLIYNRELTACVIQTWMQLRGLAWGKAETPPLSMGQLTSLTGKSQSTLYGHMTLLRSRGALRWRPSAQGTIIVNFETVVKAEPQENVPDELFQDSGFQDSKNLEKPYPLPPPYFKNIILRDEEEEEG